MTATAMLQTPHASPAEPVLVVRGMRKEFPGTLALDDVGLSVGRGEIHAKSAAAVMYAANMCNQVLDNAVQIHGGNGYIWETEINRLFRGTKLLEIGAGTTEVRKLIVAEELFRERGLRLD